MIEDATLIGRVTVPGLPCTLSATVKGRCMIATVWGEPVKGIPAPIVTFGVASHSRCAASLWRVLGGAEADRPVTPWCAARIEVGAAFATEDTMRATADLERCIAWAWLDQRKGA